MRIAIFAAAVLLAGSAVAQETPAAPAPKTYEAGVCEGYRAALAQIQAGSKNFGAFLAQSQLGAETKGWLGSGMNVVLFGPLDGHAAGQDCNQPPS